ncbi:hypothetical protein P879_04123 [Paragonimus westermani]|uniref:LRRNT domain-containing protein n=1 Tax=Paragonimus westermani TaxID=34504 RepID=A0A8T0D6M9_9TREM|nr:hypothetical protein P879_04123 [Paragonimus westermani]
MPLFEQFTRSKRLPVLLRSGATCLTDSQRSTQPLDAHFLRFINCPGNLNSYNQTPKACAVEIRNSCSTVCECSSDRTANCQRRGLTSVPSDLPTELMEL